MRTFLVHRVSDLEVNATRPSTPDFAPPEGFRLADHARVPPHRFDVHAPIAVTLDVADDAVWMLERALSSTLARSPSPRAGFARVTVETTFVDALLQTVLRLGPRVAVVDPPEVRRRILATLRRLASSPSESTR
jgi:predicted DNA-binding transcriptional regulator YafY